MAPIGHFTIIADQGPGPAIRGRLLRRFPRHEVHHQEYDIPSGDRRLHRFANTPLPAIASTPFLATAIDIINDTTSELEPVGAACSWSGSAHMSDPPLAIPANSNGAGGTMRARTSASTLSGHVAYATPDPTQTLVIAVVMSAETGTENQCWVGLVNTYNPNDTNAIDSSQCHYCYNRPVGFSTRTILSEFSQGGEDYILIVTPSVWNKLEIHTTVTVKVSLFRKGSKQVSGRESKAKQGCSACLDKIFRRKPVPASDTPDRMV